MAASFYMASRSGSVQGLWNIDRLFCVSGFYAWILHLQSSCSVQEDEDEVEDVYYDTKKNHLAKGGDADSQV